MDETRLTNGPTLAQKLDQLFKTAHSRGQRELTYEEVAQGINAMGGPTISAAYIWQLRTGAKNNPRKSHLEALARFFQVPPSYFFDDDEATRMYAEMQLLAGMRDANIRNIAARASELSSEGIRALAGIVEHLRQVEGLPPREQDAPDSD